MRAHGLVLLLMLAAPGIAPAQDIDMSKGGPIDITARDGIEWRQQEQVIVARGDTRAMRGDVTVTADRLIARYRPVPGREATTPVAAAAPRPGESRGGANEIWRLEAEGHVVIRTATDTARGDRAVYDVDNAVMVLTGRDLSLETKAQTIRASDSLEYWSQKKFAVARGNAKVVEPAEGRQITGDTLVAYFLDRPKSPPPAAPRGVPAAPGTKPVPGEGKLDRVEAFGNVEIRTPADIVRGDRGVYSAESGLARLLGGVRITHGENQVNGQEAIVNMRTGVARLVATPGSRVQGLIIPKEDKPGAAPAPGQPAKDQRR